MALRAASGSAPEQFLILLHLTMVVAKCDCPVQCRPFLTHRSPCRSMRPVCNTTLYRTAVWHRCRSTVRFAIR